MMRPPVRTKCWLCIVSSIVLVASVPSSPIRTPRTPNAHVYPKFLFRNINAHVYPNFLFQNFALVSNGFGQALGSATHGRASIDMVDCDFDEEDEDESFWSFFHLVGPTFLPSDSLPKLLSGPCPGNSPPRTAAGPLRC